MPRTYIKKTQRRTWSEDNTNAALHAVEEENISCNHASVLYSTPEPTLRRYIKKRRENIELPVHGGRFKDTFSNEQQKQFADYIKDLHQRAFGLAAFECRKLAFEFAEQNNVQHSFNKQTKAAGKDWLQNFMKKWKISLRSPESISLGRLMGFNKIEVDRFFNLLKEQMVKYNFGLDRIYNADESGLSTVPNKLPKVMSPTGERRVAKVASGERGKNTTVVCAMNAQGSFIPPFLIFSRVRMKPELLIGCPPNTCGIAQKNGWMNSESFVQYLEHFIKYSHPTIDNPVLLIVDNHSSHISLPAMNLCRKNGVIMVGLPPHTTHRLQPLAVSFFEPLKTYYSQACDNFLVNHPGQTITDREMCRLFGEAYLKAATVGNAIKGFEKCGIVPFNPTVFSDADFITSDVYERNFDDVNTEDMQSVPVSANIEESSPVDEQLVDIRRPSLEVRQKFSEDNSSPTLTKSTRSFTPIDAASAYPSTSSATGPSICQDRLRTQTPVISANTPTTTFVTSSPPEQLRSYSNSPEPSTSSKRDSNMMIEKKKQKSVWQIRPLPKYNRPVLTRTRRRQKSSVITPTPIKSMLGEKEREAELKEERKRKRKGKVENVKFNLSNEESRPINKKKKEIIMCPGCSEMFKDPPIEDWIQCVSCESWWHEACSNYDQGHFICDLCQE